MGNCKGRSRLKYEIGKATKMAAKEKPALQGRLF
jgi:hypothetical protein